MEERWVCLRHGDGQRYQSAEVIAGNSLLLTPVNNSILRRKRQIVQPRGIGIDTNAIFLIYSRNLMSSTRFYDGGHGRIRTRDLWLRRPPPYPAGPRVHAKRRGTL